jgi:hypothetical protein
MKGGRLMPDRLTELQMMQLRVLKVELDGIITRYEGKEEEIALSELTRFYSKLSKLLEPFSYQSERG